MRKFSASLALAAAIALSGCVNAEPQSIDAAAPSQSVPDGIVQRDPLPAPERPSIGNLADTDLLRFNYLDAYGENHDVVLRSDGAYYVHITDEDSSFECDRAYNPVTNTLTSYCHEPDEGPEAVIQYQQSDVASSGILSSKYPDVLPVDIRAPFLANAIAHENPATGEALLAVHYPDIDGGNNDTVIEMGGSVDLEAGVLIEATDAEGSTMLLADANNGTDGSLVLADDLDSRIAALEARYQASGAANETTRGQEQIDLAAARSLLPELASFMPESLAGVGIAEVFHEVEDPYGPVVLVYRRGVQELVVTIRPLFADEAVAEASMIDPFDEFGVGLPELSAPGVWSDIAAHPLYPEHFWTMNAHARVTVEAYLTPADVLASARAEMVDNAECSDVCITG